LIVFIEEPFDFIVFPCLLGVALWTSRLMKIDRESKQNKLK
jgi:hypothetical protein